jgi:rod shape-determining protein MreD
MSGYQPLQPWSWLLAPMLVSLFATIILATPVRFIGLSLPEPVFPMTLAFAWAVIRPSILGPFLLMAGGLFLDLFWHGELGLWAFCLVTVYGLSLLVRNLMVGQSVRVLWTWYGGFTLLAFTIAFLFTAAEAKAQPNLINTAWQALVTVLLFPFARRLIDTFEDADVRFR